jgi:hypothetical protein
LAQGIHIKNGRFKELLLLLWLESRVPMKSLWKINLKGNEVGNEVLKNLLCYIRLSNVDLQESCRSGLMMILNRGSTLLNIHFDFIVITTLSVRSFGLMNCCIYYPCSPSV